MRTMTVVALDEPDLAVLSEARRWSSLAADFLAADPEIRAQFERAFRRHAEEGNALTPRQAARLAVALWHVRSVLELASTPQFYRDGLNPLRPTESLMANAMRIERAAALDRLEETGRGAMGLALDLWGFARMALDERPDDARSQAESRGGYTLRQSDLDTIKAEFRIRPGVETIHDLYVIAPAGV